MWAVSSGYPDASRVALGARVSVLDEVLGLRERLTPASVREKCAVGLDSVHRTILAAAFQDTTQRYKAHMVLVTRQLAFLGDRGHICEVAGTGKLRPCRLPRENVDRKRGAFLTGEYATDSRQRMSDH